MLDKFGMLVSYNTPRNGRARLPVTSLLTKPPGNAHAREQLPVTRLLDGRSRIRFLLRI